MKADLLAIIGIKQVRNGYDLHTAIGIWHFADLWPAIKTAFVLGMRGL